MSKILVLNGPNLNLLGTREPAVYGSTTLADVRTLCEATGQTLGVVFNAGAYTHTSVALHDAIKGAGATTIEVHISNVHAREPFRHHSYLSAVARAVMCGFGVMGYGLAIDAVAQWQAQAAA